MGRKKIALQLSMGQLGDLSFNDSAYSGLLEAEERFGIEFITSDWQGSERNAVTVEQWAKEDFDLIIGIGFGNATLISDVAARYPDKKFAVIDVAGSGDNVWSATYREYEGDYVVGVLAGLITKSHIVGFIGGGVTPIVRRIELGFAQGVKNVDASVSFISDYVGDFNDPETGRLLAETQYMLGADVIYQVAGKCGLGAIETAKELGRYIISTGGDHSHLAPRSVLTSRIKNVGRAVCDIIGDVVHNQFQGGVVESYGFAEGGLVMAPIHPSMSHVVGRSVQNIMAEIQQQVVDGEIKVELDDA